jgi:hypothetical protein
MANNYLGLYYLEDLKATFPNLPSLRMASFWMRRRLPMADSIRESVSWLCREIASEYSRRVDALDFNC